MMTSSGSERDGFVDEISDDEMDEFLIKHYEYTLPASRDQLNISFKVKGTKYELYLTYESLPVLRLWLYYQKQYPTVADKAYLARNYYYFRSRSARESIDHIKAGGFFCVRSYTCLIDQSSTDVLNQNFLRILSIGPLMLQARRLGFASAVFSGFVVLLDICNYFANQVWKVIKDGIIVGIKYIFNVFPRTVRLECTGILSSATDKFRYSDDSKSRIYRKKVHMFVIDDGNMTVPGGCRVREMYEVGLVPQTYCDTLLSEGTTRKTYAINGQNFIVTHEFVDNSRGFPCCNLHVWIDGTERQVKKLLAERNKVYYVHTFLSTLEKANLFPVVSCSGTTIAVRNPLDLVENMTCKRCLVVDLGQASVFTIS
jgi:hypothetical protein